jgi:hypothetical protein
MARQGDDAQYARRWATDEHRRARARRLLACYQESEGRMPATSQELERWISENPDKIPLDESGRLIPLYKDESPVSNRTRGGRTD